MEASLDSNLIIRILHFNDVYNLLGDDSHVVCGGISRFVTKINSFAEPKLHLFSGDLWSPSRRM